MTYKDALDHAEAFTGGGTDTRNQNQIYAAVQDAYSHISHKRAWKYLQRFERINTIASYSTGTVDFDLTGGATVERQLTLASGTWPALAADGWVRIASVDYEIERRISDTIVQLSERAAPTADVAAGTAYTFWKDSYRFSSTVVELLFSPSHQDFYGMEQMDMGEWMEMRTRSNAGGIPTHYAVGAHPNYGYWGIFLYPYPTTARAINIMAHHRARTLFITGDATADNTQTVTSSSTTVTGSSTSFDTTNHVGSIIRFSANASDAPTGLDGRTRFAAERRIVAVASTTSLTIDSAYTAATGVKYVISDPVDLHEGMIPVFKATINREMGNKQRSKDMNRIEAIYRQGIVEAFEADRVLRPEWNWGGSDLRRVVITTG